MASRIIVNNDIAKCRNQNFSALHFDESTLLSLSYEIFGFLLINIFNLEVSIFDSREKLLYLMGYLHRTDYVLPFCNRRSGEISASPPMPTVLYIIGTG